MQIVEDIMMNFRKAALARASLLVWFSLSLSLIGRYGVDGGDVRHGLMAAATGVLSVATVVLILDLRKGNDACPVEQ